MRKCQNLGRCHMMIRVLFVCVPALRVCGYYEEVPSTWHAYMYGGLKIMRLQRLHVGRVCV